MKLVWICYRDPLGPNAGGAEKTTLKVCTGLASRGISVTIATIRQDNPSEQDRSKAEVDWKCFTNAASINLWLLKQGKTIDVLIADLAHAIPWTIPVALHRRTLVFFRHLHRRTVSGQVAYAPRSLIIAAESMYPVLFGGCRFITESPSSLHDLTSLGIRTSSISLIPPGVDSGLFVPGALTSSPSLVYFGGMRRYKRPEHSVLLLRLLLDAGIDAHLNIIGEGPALSEVVHAATHANVSNRVALLGRLPESRLAEVLSHSWLNVHCSVAEGWCLSAMEAASCGVPTVGYEVPGLKDSVRHGVTGLLAKGESPSCLLEPASRIIRSRSEWTLRCAAHAREYTWGSTLDKWFSRVVAVHE